MVRSSAATPEEYLAQLPDDRRAVVSMIRDVILRNLPNGYRESMNWGMLSYEIPLERFANTYNKQPLGYAALAAQKNGYSLYLMCAYQDSEAAERLRMGFEKAGKKLDMGKSCIRFKRLEDLPLDVIGEVVGSTTPDQFIEQYEETRKR